MKPGRPPARFDVDALRARAGATTFRRGEEYVADGAVQILAVEKDRVLSQVSGNDEYRVRLTGRDRQIGGTCSCPAFADAGFCKHMVATALVANGQGGDVDADGAGTLSRIRAHLKKKAVDDLVELVIGLAERDPALLRKLDMQSATTQGDDKTLGTRLRKTIDNATRTHGYVAYEDVDDWMEAVDEVLDAVEALVTAGRAALALGLADRAIDRIRAASEAVDDSEGQRVVLLERARDIHLAAARAARPDPVVLARALFGRETQSEDDVFDGAASLYADALGTTGLAEYRRLATDAWNKLPPPPRKAGVIDGDFVDRRQLMRILDGFAAADGDVEARLALRSQNLSSPSAYLELATFCHAQGRTAEALQRAEEALWLFEDRPPDHGLLFFAVDLLAKVGRKKDAAAHLWGAFEKEPELELYTRLRKLDGKAACERAVTLLRDRVGRQARTDWSWPADLLVSILSQEKMLDEAWMTVRAHGASPHLKMELARASRASHPQEALQVYIERVELLAGGGGSSSYKEAAALVAAMASLHGAPAQAAYVAALKLRHGRKRNFMALLV